MKLVLDTNVLIAGFIAHGMCNEVVEYGVVNHEVVVSAFILDEFQAVLTRKFGFTSEEAQAAARLVESRSTLVQPLATGSSRCRDPDDLTVIGTALAGACRCVITGDKDLLVLKQHQGIAMVSPNLFWQFEETTVEPAAVRRRGKLRM